jgi:hypothetical protein
MTNPPLTDRQIDYKLALRSAARNYNRTLILARPSVGRLPGPRPDRELLGRRALRRLVSGLGVVNSQLVQRSLVTAVTNGDTDRKQIGFGVLKRLSVVTVFAFPDRARVPAQRLDRVHRSHHLPVPHHGDVVRRSRPPGSARMSGTGTLRAADNRGRPPQDGRDPRLHGQRRHDRVEHPRGPHRAGAGLYMARRASSGRPSKLQLAFETIVDAIEKQVASSMGQVAPFVVPLALTLFLYILIANWIG